jgi:SAM-dependent methyltransferase
VKTQPLRTQLATRAARAYRASGRFAYYFARFKLGYDPFYTVLLAEGLIPAAARILDLGCAQGLLAAWLCAAEESYREGIWDGAFPAPESMASYRGVDRNPLEISRARLALGGRAEFVVGDIGVEQLSGATVIVLLDVLHYLDYPAQLKSLRAIRASLPTGGFALLRLGDSASGARARVSAWVDRVVLRFRGYRAARLHRRPLTEWLLLLRELGFTVQVIARQHSLGAANVLLRAFAEAP